MKKLCFAGSAAAAALLLAASAQATTIQVGPTRAKKTLQEVMATVQPGDVVELDGDATYPGGVFFKAAQSGTAQQKITIRGMKTNGKRPVLSGSGTGVLAGLGLVLAGSHYVLESIEVTGASSACIIHKADDVVIRDFVVHDCAGQGLLGNDDEAGSLTLELSEFYRNGSGQYSHQIYMATSEDAYPGSVFRLQHSYIHDGAGGNDVKSRAQRNEIYSNWIEGAFYHALELIGPDKYPATAPREDSDVVGNVIVGNGANQWHLVRVGGDKEEADTSGRYRFVNNTFVVGAAGNQSIVRLMLRVDTVEMHDNAILRAGAGTAPLFAAGEVTWVNGASLFGSNNWVADGLDGVPGTWTGTLRGADPGVVDIATLDLRPKEGSALVDKGVTNPASVEGRAFPNPLATPAFVPPTRQLLATASARTPNGAPDIGAYELGSASAPGVPPSASGGSDGDGGGGTGGAGADGGANGATAGSTDEGCGCGTVGRSAPAGCAGAAGLLLVAALGRRRRR